MKALLAACVSIFWLLPVPVRAAEPELPPLHAVSSLDLQRYAGRWYEIARYPNRFQRNCAAQTMAEYVLNPDGTVGVTNSCRTTSDHWISAHGQARLNGPTGTAMLEVRFAPAWLSFIPAVWGDYWVVDLDPEYRLAAVSDPKRKYLWILSRTPAISSDVYENLVSRLVNMGFDRNRLEITPQVPDNPGL